MMSVQMSQKLELFFLDEEMKAVCQEGMCFTLIRPCE